MLLDKLKMLLGKLSILFGKVISLFRNVSMRFRKIAFVFSSVVMLLLFASGIYLLQSLNTADVPTAVETGSSNPIVNILQPAIEQLKDPVNVLVIGGDKVANNADTLMLVRFNPKTSKVHLLSLPRDTKIKLDGYYNKINVVYPRGKGELSMKVVSDLLGVEIKYYIYVDTSVFRQIVDLLGGVDYNVPVDMDYDDPRQKLHIHLKKGLQHFNGAKAEQFVRFRKPNRGRYDGIIQYYDGSDIRRIDAQQDFIKELIKQKANVYNLPKLTNIINVVYKNIETNLPMNEAIKMAQVAINFKVENLDNYTLPGFARTDSGISYYICDIDETNEVVKKLFESSGVSVDMAGAVAPATTPPTLGSKATPKPTPKSSAGQVKATPKPTNPSNGDTDIEPPETELP